MKKFLSLLMVVFTLGLGTAAMEAEAAKRIGSGKSMGTQRQATPDKAPTAPIATAPAAGAAGAAAAPSRSWMGPVAGLAAGLGLAALASHLGFGDELASMVMMGLLAAAVMVAIGFVMRKRAAAQQANGSNSGGLRYATAGTNGASRTNDAAEPAQERPAYKLSMPDKGQTASGSSIGSGIGSNIGSSIGSNVNAAMIDTAPTSRIPAVFDTAGFERNAKVNFIRLQASNDAGNLDDIRQFTTPQMFAELKVEMSERGSAAQKSDVVSINATVIEVDEDAVRYVVSVRFTGVIRDEVLTQDEAFDEVWHLMKMRQGDSGWLLSGIQQSQ